jgi:hypothetical protein
MISTERKDRPKTREPGRFYIDELARLLNRRADTIRRWERSGMLPKYLHPKRGSRDWRYWTDNQVYGSRGIVAWMKREDMRPGNFFTDPSQEENHIRRLRVPKMISEDVLEEIRKYSYQITRGPDKGKWKKSREWIVATYYPQSGYLSVENFLRAVTRYFAERGWPFPPPSPRKYKQSAAKGAKTRKANARAVRRAIREDKELRSIERKADRLIRITNTK